MQTETALRLNTSDLEQEVKNMYREVALHPHEKYHFEMGRALAEKLGYDPKELDQIPQEAIESFAGVGYFFDYAAIKVGDKVLDLGSGSGMDSFLAALKVGKLGSVTGLDMTDEQLQKANKLRDQYGFSNVSFHKGYIENLPFEDNSFDVVISNGVINLCPDKSKVFKEVSRVLKPGGRIAIADIVSEKSLPDNIVCDATLWASCIGGASQEDEYSEAIKNVELNIIAVMNNETYAFISSSAQSASKKYGVKSVSLLAEKKIADVHLFVPGLACANLTPAIKKEMQNLEAGQILEVISDDYASREGVPAWCRLTGNKLLGEIHESEDKSIFYIQKKKN
ncbi:MAG TPA: methyltransferase domain-containing protein [Chitinophagaceae bacterium]|jgi:ubiquinone/menaquinone biosynthesis C-methylase UbiE|nr:methyltransferase domain-containing protein [Chitinophagaceae bacterium]